MKKFLTLSLLAFTLGGSAQNAVNLKKGQKVLIKTETTQKMEMSMGMQTNSEVKIEVEAEVTDDKQTAYELKTKVKKMKMKTEAMGNNMEYDSEKPEDKNSEIGKMVFPYLERDGKYSLDKKSGSITSLDEKKEGADMSMSPMGEAGSMTGAVGGFFVVLPSNAAVGSTWNTKTTAEGMTIVSDYKVVSIKGDVSTLEVVTTTKGEKPVEANGMQMNVNVDSKLTETVWVNNKTGLVSERKGKTEMNNSMEVMGQSMTMTGSGAVETKFEYRD